MSSVERKRSASASAGTRSNLYDSDFHAWANEQAALLRAGKFSSADIKNIAEEIAGMGRSEKRELVNRLSVLLLHLLKWRHQPGLRSASWRLTVEEQRYRLAAHLKDNPSLKSKLGEAIAEGYELAVIGCARETGFAKDAFPAAVPWSFEQMTHADFWPE
jgi:Domain of unknown function DUF29